jgi:putative transcriptional regulator
MNSKLKAEKSSAAMGSGTELGLKLLQSVRELKARKFARVTEVEVNEVVQARQGTGLSQADFASALSISKRTLQEWEQGRRSPSGAAQALIRIARKHPEVVREALS